VGRLRRHCHTDIALLASCLLLTACASAPGLEAQTATSAPSSLPGLATPTTVPKALQPVRVAVIVMENHGYDSVAGLPYIGTLVTAGTALTDYHAVSHPSLPNYLALTSGVTWGISDDGYHVLPEQDIGDQLTAAGIPWRAYMEGMGSDCRQGTGDYAVKHDPFAYYGGRCQPSVVPFSELPGDLAGASPPRFIWITPNLCDDMHDCSPTVGDSWLRETVPLLLASPAMTNGVVFITWDENEGGGSNQVLTLVLGSRHATEPASTYSHPSLLATVEDLLGVPRLGATRAVPAIALG
jgi:phosphatidylinositol-3-phosphatase